MGRGEWQTDQKGSSHLGSEETSNPSSSIIIPTFEKQLEAFKKLGFDLNPGVEASDIYQWRGSKEEFEKSFPYMLMYVSLGLTIDREPWTPITNKVYDFDGETINDHGDYIRILKNVSRITNGELVLEDIDDYIDTFKGIVWVSFTCRGVKYRWNLKVEYDWVDEGLFERLQSLAEKYNTKGRFTILTTWGQDLPVGYHTPEEVDRIRKATGLNIVLYKAKKL